MSSQQTDLQENSDTPRASAMDQKLRRHTPERQHRFFTVTIQNDLKNNIVQLFKAIIKENMAKDGYKEK